MPERAVNEETGQVLEKRNGEWVPVESARNPDTGAIAVRGGDGWETIFEGAPKRQDLGDIFQEQLGSPAIEEQPKPERTGIRENVSGFMSDVGGALAVEGSLVGAPSGPRTQTTEGIDAFVQGLANVPSRFVEKPIETAYEISGAKAGTEAVSSTLGVSKHLAAGDIEAAKAEAARIGPNALEALLSAIGARGVRDAGKAIAQQLPKDTAVDAAQAKAKEMLALSEDVSANIKEAFKGDDATARAADAMLLEMKREGITSADIEAIARKKRKQTQGTKEARQKTTDIVGESMGVHGGKLMRALASVSGPAATTAAKVLKARAEKTFEQLSGAAKDFGAKDFVGEKKAIIQGRKEAAKEAYDIFRASPVDQKVFDKRVAPMLASDEGKRLLEIVEKGFKTQANNARAGAIDKAGDTLKLTADQLDGMAAAVKAYRAGKSTTLPPAALDEVKKGFDDLIEKASRGGEEYTAKILRKSKNSFADAVDASTNGTYAIARDIFGGGKAIEDAYDLGVRATNKKTWELEEAIDKIKLKYPQFGSDQTAALAAGFSRSIRDMIERNDLAAARKILKDKKLQSNFKSIMGEDQFKRFEARVSKVIEQQKTKDFVLGGSPTARIADDIAERTNDGSLEKALDKIGESGITAFPSLQGMFIQAVSKPSAIALRNVITNMRRGGIKDEEVNKILGDWLFSTATEGNVKKITKILNDRLAQKGQKSVNPIKRISKAKGGEVTPASAGMAAGTAAGAVMGSQSDIDGDGEKGTVADMALAALFGGVGSAALAGGAKRASQTSKSFKEKQRNKSIDSWNKKNVEEVSSSKMGKFQEDVLRVNDEFDVNILESGGEAQVSFLQDGKVVNDAKLMPDAMLALHKWVRDNKPEGLTLIADNPEQQRMLDKLFEHMRLDNYKVVKSTQKGGKGSAKASDAPYYMITPKGNSGKHFTNNPKTKYRTFPLNGKPIDGATSLDEWLLEDPIKKRLKEKPNFGYETKAGKPKLTRAQEEANMKTEMLAQKREGRGKGRKRKSMADLAAENKIELEEVIASIKERKK